MQAATETAKVALTSNERTGQASRSSLPEISDHRLDAIKAKFQSSKRGGLAILFATRLAIRHNPRLETNLSVAGVPRSLEDRVAMSIVSHSALKTCSASAAALARLLGLLLLSRP